jgi:hypothetical protein
MNTNTTKLTLKTTGTEDEVATATVTHEVAAGDAQIDNQVQALMAADLDLPDGEYDVYDESTRHMGPDYVIASSAGVISAQWRAATLADGQWDGILVGMIVIERD